MVINKIFRTIAIVKCSIKIEIPFEISIFFI